MTAMSFRGSNALHRRHRRRRSVTRQLGPTQSRKLGERYRRATMRLPDLPEHTPVVATIISIAVERDVVERLIADELRHRIGELYPPARSLILVARIRITSGCMI